MRPHKEREEDSSDSDYEEVVMQVMKVDIQRRSQKLSENLSAQSVFSTKLLKTEPRLSQNYEQFLWENLDNPNNFDSLKQFY